MTCSAQLTLDLTKPRALDCVAPICEGDRCRQTVCPYARDAARTKFLVEHKRRRRLGPLPWFHGLWLETVMGFNPWGAA